MDEKAGGNGQKVTTLRIAGLAAVLSLLVGLALGVTWSASKCAPDGSRDAVLTEIRAFQQANGLDPDGLVGPLTAAKLYGADGA